MSVALNIAELDRAICSWRHPELTRGPNASRTKLSRPPAWWDRHLAERYCIESVVVTNGVGRLLTALYDGIHSTLPADFENPAYAAMLRAAFGFFRFVNMNDRVENEAQLETIHIGLSPGICSVASNLYLLHLWSAFPTSFDPMTFSWDTHFLYQTKDSSTPPITDIVDRVFKFTDTVAFHIPLELVEVLRVMQDRTLSNTEAKFDSVATELVAQQIPTLVGQKYPWKLCTNPNEATHGPHTVHTITKPKKMTADAERWKPILKEMRAEPSSSGWPGDPSAVVLESILSTSSAHPNPLPPPPPTRRSSRSTNAGNHQEYSDDEETQKTAKRRRNNDDASFEGKPQLKKPKLLPEEAAHQTATSWIQQVHGSHDHAVPETDPLH